MTDTQKAPRKMMKKLFAIQRIITHPVDGSASVADIPVEKDLESTAAAWDYVLNTQSLVDGKYRVVQVCGLERVKNTTTVTETVLV